jgi:hypothetical protein
MVIILINRDIASSEQVKENHQTEEAFISPNIAVPMGSRSQLVLPVLGEFQRIRALKSLFDARNFEKIYFTKLDGKKRTIYRKRYDGYEILVAGSGRGTVPFPYIFIVYINELNNDAENPFLIWWLDLMGKIYPNWTFRDFMKCLPSEDIFDNYERFHSKLTSVDVNDLKENLYKAFCVGIPSKQRRNISEFFGRVYLSKFEYIHKKILYVENAPPNLWEYTIWKVYIAPMFVACYTDGIPYRLISADLSDF